MDDSTRLKAQFPLGDTGDTFVVMRPTEGQLLMLAISREPSTKDDLGPLIRRMFSIMRKVMGAQEWQRLEDAMIDETYTVTELLNFVQEVVTFRWSDHSPDTIPLPADHSAAARNVITQEGAAVRPAPRVING
jgi:hypothetical protein